MEKRPERHIVEWTIDYIFKSREQFVPADYQRYPKLWNWDQKRLLIDSILKDIDIPKIYLNEIDKNEYEVIDGQQRLYAILEFIDNEYSYETKDKDKQFPEIEGKKFNKFPENYKKHIRDYELQFTIIKKATDDYLRKLFLRLQLGLLLVAGEKLKAETGQMRDFIFKEMVKHPFFESLNILNRRYAKQALCAQICINSFKRAKTKSFYRTRYEDLEYFFKDYKKVTGDELKFFNERCEHIIRVLNIIYKHFEPEIKVLKNRSFILSLYLFVEELVPTLAKKEMDKVMQDLVEFTPMFLKRLKEESKKGFDRENKDLYSFESYLSNAPGEKYQIENRDNKLKEFFEYYQKVGKIMGDK
jgi:hypothetical protein